MSKKDLFKKFQQTKTGCRVGGVNGVKYGGRHGEIYGCPCCLRWPVPAIKKWSRRLARAKLKRIDNKMKEAYMT